MEKSNKNYFWHRRLAFLVFYSCILAFSFAFLFSLLSNSKISEHLEIPLFICALLPAIVGVIQEVLFGFKLWIRVIFIIPMVYLSLGLFFPSLIVKNGVLEGIIVVFFFAGWIMFLLRWFDAKQLFPLIHLGIKDFKNGDIYSYEDYDDDGNKIHLEVLPKSQLIFKFQGEYIDSWEKAELAEILHAPPDEYLAPWYYASDEFQTKDIKYYQRCSTDSELKEIENIRKMFLHKFWISILPCIYLSAVCIRLIENILNSNLESSISSHGWLAAIIIGLIIPFKYLKKWKDLSKDIEVRVIVSVWLLDESQQKNQNLEEYLQESGLLWSQRNYPSIWRLASKY